MRRLVTVLALVFVIAPALAASDWNGTWVGNWQSTDGNGIQIMMAGNVATGIYWRGDYLPDELHSKVSSDGKTLTITWDHSRAVLTRDAVDSAHIVLHEPDHSDSAFAIKLDK